MANWQAHDSHREVPSPFEPSLLESPLWVNSFHKKKAVKVESIEEDGVAEKIYANWIKEELQKEAACLELPFSVVFLASFAFFALGYLAQDVVMSVENSIETDITENANFAFEAWPRMCCTIFLGLEGYFGNKVIGDVNSFADFWSWTRLGLLPLVFPEMPYLYSEGLAEAVPEGYNVSALPQRWLYPGYEKPAPVQNDYLRYNRIIGGLRFRQEVSTDDKATCTHFGDEATFRTWIGKPCTHFTEYELPPDLMATEAFNSAPQRVEWFLPEVEGTSALVQHVIDMEDGCFSARAQNRTCLCQWCDAQVGPHPWLDEQTQRVEVAFITYNAHYGQRPCFTSCTFGGNGKTLLFLGSRLQRRIVRTPPFAVSHPWRGPLELISHRNSTIDPGWAWPFTKDQFSGIQCQIGVHICANDPSEAGIRHGGQLSGDLHQRHRQHHLDVGYRRCSEDNLKICCTTTCDSTGGTLSGQDCIDLFRAVEASICWSVASPRVCVDTMTVSGTLSASAQLKLVAADRTAEAASRNRIGLYNLATANFWFSRGGNIFKLVFVRSSWAGLEVREPGVLALIAASGVLWVAGCLYLAKGELLEMARMIQRSNKIWYYTLAQDYLGFWNCVDWLAIIMTTVISISFGVLHIFIGDVNGKLGAIVMEVDSNGYPPLETYREIASAPEISLCQWLDVIVPDTTMLVEVGVQVPRDAFQIFGSRKSVTSDPAI
eukprot:s167_g17.t2